MSGRAVVRGWIAAALVLGAAAGASFAQEPANARLGEGSRRVADLGARLAALKPDRARAYFELGEEVASEASEDMDRRLARQLYVLAFELDRRSKAPDPQLGASVCLALAAVAETDDEKRWLAAMAESLAPDGTPDVRRMKATSASRDPAAFDLATMLSFVRTGEGRRATRILEKPGVNELLDKCDKLLSPGIGGANRVRQRIDEWPNCPQCRGRRTIKDATGVHLCPTCHGVPGPTLTGAELVGHIRTESVLLSGQQRSWSGQLTSDAGATLRELDPNELAATYGVTPARAFWRDGVWVPDPSGPAAPAEKSAAGKDAGDTGAAAPAGDAGKKAG